MGKWEEAQEWERLWWDSTVHNSLFEEQKQLIYANAMGLTFTPDKKTPYNIDLNGKSVIDIGGGPTSLLLKSYNGHNLIVVDPLEYPDWVIDRYKSVGIEFVKGKGEDLPRLIAGMADEIWVYNCLQHTQDPEKIITNAQQYSDIIRLFEWVNTPITDGHLQVLTEARLNLALGGEGKVKQFNGENGCWGNAYAGIFPTKKGE